MSILCLKCGYSITEPLCAFCIINEIKIWLSEQSLKNDSARKINKELKRLLQQIELLDYASAISKNSRNFSTVDCIRCSREMHLMCFYCVINQASQIIKNNLGNSRSMEIFQEYFNTELYDYELSRGNRVKEIINFQAAH